MPKAEVLEGEAWTRALAHLEKQDAEPSLAERIFRKAAEGTIDIQVRGETVTCRRPGQRMRERIINAFADAVKLAQAARESGDRLSVEQTMAIARAQAKEICEVAELMTLDESLNAAAFLADDFGLETATYIVIELMRKIRTEVEAVASFRQQP